MKSKNRLKETDIKIRLFYYFDDAINGAKINFSNILLDEKLYENISVYNILCKTPTGPKPLLLGSIKLMDLLQLLMVKLNIQYFFDYEIFDKTCDKIKYLIKRKSGITNIINYNLERVRIESYNSLPIKKILTFHNVIIIIKSDVNRNENKYCYNIFLEKRFI